MTMRRAGRAVYRRVRAERRAFVIRHRSRILTVAVGWTALGAVLTWLMPNLYLQGVATGGFGMLVGVVLPMLVWQASGTANKRLGGDAEQFTSEEMRPLRKAGWQVVHDVPFGSYNIDHVALGPGTLLVFETKWTSRRVVCQSAWMRSAADQVRRHARVVRQQLRYDPRRVVPVVVVWGPGGAGLPDGVTRLDDVRVIRGSELRTWLRSALARAGDGRPAPDEVAGLRTLVKERGRYEQRQRRRGSAVALRRS